MDKLKHELLRKHILSLLNNISTISTHENSNSTPTSNSTAIPQYHYPLAEDILWFSYKYRKVHGYLALVICVFGILANLCNIVVLTRKNMSSSTNCILTALAVSDVLTMAVYLPFALRFYCLYGTQPSAERNTLAAVRYMLFFACFSVFVHTISIFLTLTLTVFRCIFLQYPNHRHKLCTVRRAKIAIFTVIILSIVLTVPNILTLTIEGTCDENNEEIDSHISNDQTEFEYLIKIKVHNKTEFTSRNSSHIVFTNSFRNDTYQNRNQPSSKCVIWRVIFRDDITNSVHVVNFWVQALLVKFLPCIILTALSITLIRSIHRVDIRRAILLGRKTHHSTDKMTILLAVVFLFLITEFPHGILSLLSGVLDHFVYEVYEPMGDILDIVALINNSINFILYCTMSKKFKMTFKKTVLSPVNVWVKKLSIFLYYLSPYSYITQ